MVQGKSSDLEKAEALGDIFYVTSGSITIIVSCVTFLYVLFATQHLRSALY
jgi:hypothetical protein